MHVSRFTRFPCYPAENCLYSDVVCWGQNKLESTQSVYTSIKAGRAY